MKVKEIMTANPRVCTGATNLAEAASFMWEGDCGILPVVAKGGVVVGLVTDRDICIAGATKNRSLSDIVVDEIMTGKVYFCEPEDDVRKALEVMQQGRVRRLPVIARDGKLEGILSLNDVTLKAEENSGKKVPDVSFRDVVQTYKVICAHPLPAKQSAKAMKASA